MREWEILAIIQREKDWSFWQQLNYVMEKPHIGSVRCVLVEDEEQGTLTEHFTQELVQKAIFNSNHQKRFFFLSGVVATRDWVSYRRGLF